ncbi:MAG: 5,6-dimethylbenzimidazole synthase [Nitrospirota bacterium]|nr:5,6-dimethylbenzimidazole synthase [Nitrospirota bacterium]
MTDERIEGGHPDWSLPFAERMGVYHAIYTRRDIRKEFLPDPVEQDVLVRLLKAAHHAPSVGFMQPWNFLLVENPAIRRELKRVVDKERRAAAIVFESPRSEKFLSLKVEAILDAPVLIAVTIDPAREGPFVLGRMSDQDTDVYSASCAIMNLWLAARAEGIGMGWVTIFRREDVQGILNLPYHVRPIGLLCLGYVKEFPRRPMLETEDWAYRQPLSKHVFVDGWNRQEGDLWEKIHKELDQQDEWPWEH